MPSTDFGSNNRSPGGWGGSGTASPGGQGGMGGQKSSGPTYGYNAMKNADPNAPGRAMGNWNTGGPKVGMGNQNGVFDREGRRIGGAMPQQHDIARAMGNNPLRSLFSGGKGGGGGGSGKRNPVTGAPVEGVTQGPASALKRKTVSNFIQGAPPPPPGTAEYQQYIADAARRLGMSPVDLATIISYETGGTFSPTQPGPVTKWGQHKGWIQWGEPQADEYGVNWNDPQSQADAIVKYYEKNGWQPGMSMEDAYSIVNAGAPGRGGWSDAQNGGAPGTVRDKVNNQMGAHRTKAESYMKGYY